MTDSQKHGIKKRNEIMTAIIGYIQQHQYPPTFREIGEMVNLKSTSSIQGHINKLLAEGRLETDAGYNSPRALRVQGYRFVKECDKYEEEAR